MAWWVHFLACLDSSTVLDLKPESQFLWLGGRPCHVTSSCEQSRHMDAAWCVTFRGISTDVSERLRSTFNPLSAWLPLGRILRETVKCICSSVLPHTVGIAQPRVRGVRIFLMSSWQIYPPFLSYHQRPGSHIEKN